MKRINSLMAPAAAVSLRLAAGATFASDAGSHATDERQGYRMMAQGMPGQMPEMPNKMPTEGMPGQMPGQQPDTPAQGSGSGG